MHVHRMQSQPFGSAWGTDPRARIPGRGSPHEGAGAPWARVVNILPNGLKFHEPICRAKIQVFSYNFVPSDRALCWPFFDFSEILSGT